MRHIFSQRRKEPMKSINYQEEQMPFTNYQLVKIVVLHGYYKDLQNLIIYSMRSKNNMQIPVT